MPGPLLTTASRIMCPHGGQAILATTNPSTSAGALVLLETDVHQVAACPFTVSGKYSPCVLIRWTAGAQAVTIFGVKALVQSSVGMCHSGEGVVQGVALVVQTQLRATAR